MQPGEATRHFMSSGVRCVFPIGRLAIKSAVAAALLCGPTVLVFGHDTVPELKSYGKDAYNTVADIVQNATSPFRTPAPSEPVELPWYPGRTP
jgi:hypothetical protein